MTKFIAIFFLPRLLTMELFIVQGVFFIDKILIKNDRKP